ncbi:MAG: HAD-IIIA family hydrolase [Bacteroidetes bacterium]|nr:HAD-IIIA family hydrolase [Bacteroidota bacterium]
MKEQKPNLKDLGIDKTWTLFLDRDGVINHRIEGDYVRDWAQFIFLPSAAEAIRRLSTVFGRLIVITNQRGVSRNLIREGDLTEIHERMIETIRKIGGRIDGIYICPHDLDAQCKCRKPEIGLALEAKRDFPSIAFSKSVMAGDNSSDVVFAKTLNMKSVLIKDDDKDGSQEVMADFIFKDLLEFALSL